MDDPYSKSSIQYVLKIFDKKLLRKLKKKKVTKQFN